MQRKRWCESLLSTGKPHLHFSLKYGSSFKLGVALGLNTRKLSIPALHDGETLFQFLSERKVYFAFSVHEYAL